MTPLHKKVIRKTMRPEARMGNRQLVVILEPGDIIGIKEFGRRTIYRAKIEEVFSFLAKRYAAEVAKRKALERKMRRKS